MQAVCLSIFTIGEVAGIVGVRGSVVGRSSPTLTHGAGRRVGRFGEVRFQPGTSAGRQASSGGAAGLAVNPCSGEVRIPTGTVRRRRRAGIAPGRTNGLRGFFKGVSTRHQKYFLAHRMGNVGIRDGAKRVQARNFAKAAKIRASPLFANW
jgi:hypothetical protein